MKKILIYALPVILLSSTLSSCGDSDTNISSYNPDFGGKWQSTSCEEGSNSYSYIQKWNIVSVEGVGTDRAGAKFEDTIQVWSQPNCPSSVDSELLTVKGFLLTYDPNRVFDSICKEGKAYKTSLTLSYFKSEAKQIGGNNEEVTLEMGEEIRDILMSKSLNNLLPYLGLMCVDTTGKLYTGDTETGDGSTPSKRPTQMNLTNSLITN